MRQQFRSRRSRLLYAGAATVLAVAATAMVIVGGTASAQQSTLRDAAASRGIVFGTALATGPLSDSRYSTIAGQQFSSITAENAMKWDTVQSSEGNFNFGPGDQVVNFANQNNQVVYGHTLVWHSQAPQWVQNKPASELDDVMVNHITEVMQHWAGETEYWDVANEIFEGNGQRRQSFWQQKLGDGYVQQAFQAARQADPNAKLCLNDYSIDGINAKSTAYYNLAQQLVNQGLLDCMGFQAHLIVGQVPGDMQQNLQRFASLGLEVRVTELDIRMNTPASQQNLQQQASDYAAVTNACLAVNGCTGITVWGVDDGHSWVPDTFPGEGAALLYDANYNPKPAYDAVLQALGGGNGGDTEAPTAPGTPSPSNVTSNSVSLSWSAASDNVGVTRYQVVSVSGGSETPVATVTGNPPATSTTVTGLNPTTNYTVAVYAYDAAGNQSSRSSTAAFTTEEGPGGGGDCQVSYSTNDWNTGFTATVLITNGGSSTIDGWTLQFSFSAGQSLTQGWSATWSQSGSTVTATNASWNGSVASGSTVQIGFNGSHSGNNPAPTAFTLNGAACTT